jgi:hypothetical protein
VSTAHLNRNQERYTESVHAVSTSTMHFSHIQFKNLGCA